MKCDICTATGYIENEIFTEVKQHAVHQDMSEEIQRLQLLQRCRKRAADEPTHSLRRIFDTETQSSGSAAAGAATSFAFADIESSTYKRRRLRLPILPTYANDVVARITGTRFEMCAGARFSKLLNIFPKFFLSYF